MYIKKGAGGWPTAFFFPTAYHLLNYNELNFDRPNIISFLSFWVGWVHMSLSRAPTRLYTHTHTHTNKSSIIAR
mgnify:CR=1 FL=1